MDNFDEESLDFIFYGKGGIFLINLLLVWKNFILRANGEILFSLGRILISIGGILFFSKGRISIERRENFI